MIKLLFCLLLSVPCLTAHCNGKPKEYFVNEEPIWADEPRLLKVHKFGKLYEVGAGDAAMKLIHVYGTPYEMGVAQGSLLKEELNSFINELWAYLNSQIDDIFPKYLPLVVRDSFSSDLASTALDLTYYLTLPYTKKIYYQEIRGIADASGVSYQTLRRVHMIGEITKGHCSMFGAWGEATNVGDAVQLRALDWDFDGPYRKYPALTVYHPSSKVYGQSWMNIGFMGWVGVISGVNENQLAVSEIGVSYPDATFGKESRVGDPFTFILRDVLQFDTSLTEAISRMKNTRRTCNLILGVGDGKAQSFRGFQYGHSVLNVVNDSQPLPANSTWHPAIKDVVYWGMDWDCPSFHERLAEMLTKFHGNITALNTIRYIVPGLNSGNLQTVVYDLTGQKVYIAYGHVFENDTRVEAYKRPYLQLDLKALFQEKLN